jgi:1-deoxy-D-xylulose-5-phosphate reductoisomerase
MPTKEKTIVVLGSTGSIGRQTLEMAAQHHDRLRVVGLAAGSNAAGLRSQAEEWNVAQVALADEAAAERLGADSGLRVHAGAAGLCSLVRELRADLVVAALSGGAGLASLLAALEAGSDVALANKEPLVAAGSLVTQAAARAGRQLLPIDSEISAVWQCLRGESRPDVEKVLLTASGGPFSGWEPKALAEVTPEQALAHPTWRMGPKVTVDSATLMNKGFEIFEIKWLFGLEFRQIEVLIHHQSVIHSAVQFCDGSTLAQMGQPDMRVPIQFALSYPERWPNAVPRMDLPALQQLTFARPDATRFPCLRLAREAGEAGGSYPAVLSAADEVAVEAFLGGRLRFTEIPRVLERVLEAHERLPLTSLDEVQRAEAWGREQARRLLAPGG